MSKLQIILGSRSDMKVVITSGMSKVLDTVDVSYDVHVCSAHRNSEELTELVREACAGGAEVFIGIAGMAAALPGALAATTKMMYPVLGVPLDEHGIDSCLYMPPGVPVATMGVGSAGLLNAAIFACQVLIRGTEGQRVALEAYLAASAAKKPVERHIDKDEIRPNPAS